MAPTRSTSTVPFPAAVAVNKEDIRGASAGSAGSIETYRIPGEALFALKSHAIHDFLTRELETPLLDSMYPFMWWVAQRSGLRVDPLHRHKIKLRAIVIAEDPGLHMVWHKRVIYLKPLPECLLNWDFWNTFLTPAPDGSGVGFDLSVRNRRRALGFLRSYALLIQHRSDFILAQEAHLIPSKTSYESFSTFIACFRSLRDLDVAERYHYAQIRSVRLTWVSLIFRPRRARTVTTYMIPHWSVGLFLESAIAPLFFAFASVSLVLSSMQVILTVPPETLNFSRLGDTGVETLRRAFWVFSVAVLFLSGLCWLALSAVPLLATSWQLAWGYRHRRGVAKPIF